MQKGYVVVVVGRVVGVVVVGVIVVAVRRTAGPVVRMVVPSLFRFMLNGVDCEGKRIVGERRKI